MPHDDRDQHDRTLSDAETRSWSDRPAREFEAGEGPLTRDRAASIVGARYRILAEATSGGIGSVFPAFDERLQRKVAIKFLRSGSAADERGALLSEARAMAGLRHRNICTVHEVSTESAVPYIVMEWIEGVQFHAAMPASDLRWRMSQFVRLLNAMEAAHRKNVVHRDLKPQNIIIDHQGELVVVDFGLAASAERSGESSRGGTPGYAAPEQFAGASVGPSADVYALGVILFQILTDRLPFPSGSLSEYRAMVETRDPPLPGDFCSDAPWPLQRICLASLERDPAKRYQTAREMLDDVERYLRGETVSAKPTILAQQFFEQVEEQIERVEQWRRRGLVTATESDRIERVLHGVLRPESHWIVDSRRISWSQVTLYTGGWLVLVALAIGTGFILTQAETLPAVWHVAPPVAASMVLTVIGLALYQCGHRHVFLGFLMTACLSIPVVVWIVLRRFHWLSGFGDRELLDFLTFESVSEVEGLSSAQIAAESLALFAASLALRVYTRSSAFTPFAVFSGVMMWMSLWAASGMLHAESRWSNAGFGAWLLMLGGAALVPGLRLNAREESFAREVGRGHSRRRDSWAVLTVSAATVAIGLAVIASNAPEIQTLNLFPSYDEYASDWSATAPAAPKHPEYADELETTTICAAYMVNGLALLGLLLLFERKRTIVRRRLGELLRWIMPSHVLAAMLILELDLSDDGGSMTARLAWIVVLAALSVVLAYSSIYRQWRPFLLSGLFYIAAAYGRSAFWLIERLEDREQAIQERGILIQALAALVAGMLIMIVAWRTPAWVSKSRLSKWAHRHSPEMPDGHQDD